MTMKLISSYYWQQEKNASALLLLQCRFKKTELLFACVCEGEEGGQAAEYLSGRLREWFRRLRLSRAAGNPDRFLRRQETALERLIEHTDAELARAACRTESLPQTVPGGAGLAGILCVGEACLVFGRGDAEVRLLNRRMGRPCSENALEWKAGLRTAQGILEPGAALLLATGSFLESVCGEAVQAGLYVEETASEERAETRLRELGKIGEAAGGVNMAAVFLAAGEEAYE